MHIAQGLVWAIEHCVRWESEIRIPTRRGEPVAGWVSHCKVQAVSASRVMFDEKFHQALAG